MSDSEIIDIEPEPTVTSLARREQAGITRPVAAQKDVVAAFAEYAQARDALLGDDDYQEFWEKGRKSRFVKRSGWRKLAIAYGVTFEIREREILRDERGEVYDAEFVVRATAPNGRYADGWGACSGFERCCQPGCTRDKTKYGKPTGHKHCPAFDGQPCSPANHFSKPRHDIPATAETRAKNRAAADLFGMGEVSAEEITRGHAPDDDEDESPPAEPVRPAVYDGPSIAAFVDKGPDTSTIASMVEDVRTLYSMMMGAQLWPNDAWDRSVEKHGDPARIRSREQAQKMAEQAFAHARKTLPEVPHGEPFDEE